MPPIVIYIAVGMLWIGAAPLPIGYYTLLRMVVTIVFAWAAYTANQQENNTLPYIFGLLALLFNPIFPIYLEKNLWVVIDIAAGVFLLATSRNIKQLSETTVAEVDDSQLNESEQQSSEE